MPLISKPDNVFYCMDFSINLIGKFFFYRIEMGMCVCVCVLWGGGVYVCTKEDVLMDENLLESKFYFYEIQRSG